MDSQPNRPLTPYGTRPSSGSTLRCSPTPLTAGAGWRESARRASPKGRPAEVVRRSAQELYLITEKQGDIS
jgi:hypothetical protein